jgi:Integral membrane protein TerC family.
VTLSIPLWFEVGSLVVLSLVLILDLLRVMWKPHVPSTKESALWVSFYVTLALVFAGAMFVFSGEKYGSEFLAGWVTEYSLSVDNLFVFVLIMASFAVPKRFQQKSSWWASCWPSCFGAFSSC